MVLVAVAKVLEVVTWLVALRAVRVTAVRMNTASMFVVEKAQAVIPSRSVVLVFVVVILLVIVLCGACWW